jgi:hypothetical protein
MLCCVQIMKWLLQRLRPRETDSNKEYASEILTILVQVRAGGPHMLFLLSCGELYGYGYGAAALYCNPPHAPAAL